MKPKTIWLFTNRTCAVLDETGAQMGELQAAITCYSIEPAIALRITQEAQEFYVAQWKGWRHLISREEMQYLLGLRTREMDLTQARGTT